MILIHKPDLSRRQNKRLKTTKIYSLKFWIWEITRKLSDEIFLFESSEYGSIAYSDHHKGAPQSSHHVETPHRYAGRKGDSKISIERLLPPH